MNRPEHPIDAAVRRLPLDDDEHARLLSDRDAKHDLFQEIITMPVDIDTPRTSTAPAARAPRRMALTAGLASVSIAAVAGAVALLSSGSTSVGCHVPDSGLVVADAVTGDPVVDCAAIWEETTGTPAPELASYDNGLGGIEVLRADESAPEGWTPTGPGTVQDPVLIELKAALGDIADGLSAECHLADDARDIATAELARLGLAGWTAVTERGEADGVDTCTHFYLESGRQEVVLIPVEGGQIPHDQPVSVFARDLADDLDGTCRTLAEAAASARRLSADAGLDPAGVTFHELADDAATCARADVNVGGRVEVSLRGPTA